MNWRQCRAATPIKTSRAQRLELENGLELTMKRGDTLVQQANIHGWKNTGTEPRLVAFVLMSTDA